MFKLLAIINLLWLYSCAKEFSCEGCWQNITCLMVHGKNINYTDTSGDGIIDTIYYAGVGEMTIPSYQFPTLHLIFMPKWVYDTVVIRKSFCWDKKDEKSDQYIY